MKHLFTLQAAVGVLGATAVCHAVTIDLADPTVGNQAAGKTSYTYQDAGGTGVDMTVSASTTTKTRTTPTIYFQTGDGLGVKSGDDNKSNPASFIADDWETTKDEVNQNEKLTVSFSEAVEIESIGLTDLYESPDRGSYTWVPDEAGKWTLYDAGGKAVATGKFEGLEQRNPNGSSSYTNHPTNGELIVDIGEIAKAITLESTIKGTEGQYKGFSLASVSFKTVSVPELSASGASSAGLLIAGAGLLLSSRRRRSSGKS